MRMPGVLLLLLLFMTVTCCSSTINTKTLMDKEYEQIQRQQGQQQMEVRFEREGKQLLENSVGYPGSTVENHHNIPRQQFNGWGGNAGQQPAAGSGDEEKGGADGGSN
uniref:Rab GTPase-activating protein 1 n=1 Tax=Anthurium amnicola TaxID=1678845 RepID=A0A1D1XVL3_9ARAE